MTTRPVQHGAGSIGPVSSDRQAPSVLRVRAGCGGRLSTATAASIARALAGDGAVLTLPPPIPVQRSHGSTRPAECASRTVKPLYLQTYFRLAASGLRGKAAADNQSLLLHRPQATVSLPAVSYRADRLRTAGNVTICLELKIQNQKLTHGDCTTAALS